MSIRSDGKEAVSFLKLNESLGKYSLLDVIIKTGRTHQIRVHLASKKLPIIGDKTYNHSSNISKNTSQRLMNIIRNFPRQALHSSQLEFNDLGSNKSLSYCAPIPDDIENLIKQIKKEYLNT